MRFEYFNNAWMSVEPKKAISFRWTSRRVHLKNFIWFTVERIRKLLNLTKDFFLFFSLSAQKKSFYTVTEIELE